MTDQPPRCAWVVYTVKPSHTPLRSFTTSKFCGAEPRPGTVLCDAHHAEQDDLNRMVARRNAQKMRDFLKAKESR